VALALFLLGLTMTKRTKGYWRRRALEWPCWFFHRTYRIPIWNRSVFLSCPITWACNRFPRFDDWYWKSTMDRWELDDDQ